jgi:DNA transformation protein and related proteins
MTALSELPNIGPVLEAHLQAVGIETPEQLQETGAEEAFMRIRERRDSGACLHMLYGIKGALLGIPDTLLPCEMKEELKTFYRSL